MALDAGCVNDAKHGLRGLFSPATRTTRQKEKDLKKRGQKPPWGKRTLPDSMSKGQTPCGKQLLLSKAQITSGSKIRQQREYERRRPGEQVQKEELWFIENFAQNRQINGTLRDRSAHAKSDSPKT